MKFFCFLLAGCCILGSGVRAQSKDKLLHQVIRQYDIGDKEAFLKRIDEVNHDIATRGVVLYEPDNRKLMTGYAYHEMYDWDLYFENLYMSYFGIADYCFTNLKSFLNQQCVNGFISRTLIGNGSILSPSWRRLPNWVRGKRAITHGSKSVEIGGESRSVQHSSRSPITSS